MRATPSDRPVLPSMAIARPTARWHRRRRRRLPDLNAHVVACGSEGAGVLGMPCDSVDAAAWMCVESFDEDAVGAPYVYLRI